MNRLDTVFIHYRFCFVQANRQCDAVGLRPCEVLDPLKMFLRIRPV